MWYWNKQWGIFWKICLCVNGGRYRTAKLPEDKRKEDETRFKEVTEANEVLSDPQKRKAYDKDPTSNPTGAYDSFADYQAKHPKWRKETSPLPNNLSKDQQLTYTLNTINNFFLYEVNLKKQIQDLHIK